MRRRRRIIKKIVFAIRILFLLSLSFTCIYGGLYLENLSKPKTIMNNSFDKVRLLLKSYLKEEFKYNLGENYSVKSDLKFNLTSDYYYNQRLVDEDSLKKCNLIINLDNLDSNYYFVHDYKNKKIYAEMNNKIGEEDINSFKFYAENSTQYYLVNGIVPTYVNNGNFNYFESISDEVSSRNNIEYLYDYFFNSLSSSVSDDDISEYDVSQNINGKSMDLHEVSIKFSNRVIRESLDNYLEILKKDERTYNLINNVSNNFSDYRFDDSKSYIDNDESITFNIYTTKYLFKPVKYELIHIKGNERYTYYFEVNEDLGTFYIVKGDELQYKIDFKMNDKSINGTIMDSDFREIGSLKLTRDNTGIESSYSFDNGTYKSDIFYTSKYSDVVSKKSFNNTKTLTLKIIDNGVNKLNGDITLKSVVNSDTIINEDISGAVLSSSLNEETKQKLNNKFDDTINRLER